MIFDDIRDIMNSDSARRISRKTGLSKDKVWRMANGLSFNLDPNAIYALQRLGYEIKIEKLSHEKTTS